MNVHQIMSGFADGDAVSREAVVLRDIFRKWGHTADIFADYDVVSPECRADCRPLSDYSGAQGDVCLHHYGIASAASDVFMSSRARGILIYHNITPHSFFEGFDDEIARRLCLARKSLFDIANGAEEVWADSCFNAKELMELGVADVKVFPLLFNPDFLNCAPDPLVEERITRNLKNILFVGRIAPNKRIEDLIFAFAWYHKKINPYSRLVIVGSDRSAPLYHTMLRMIAGDMDMPNVCFEGFASNAGLVAYYKAADVYVCASSHEGYCLPLLEAMYMEVPVIALDAGGMPEAMNNAGVLYENMDSPELAELINRVISDSAIRNEILSSQKQRVAQIKQRDAETELKELMANILTKP